ncbi:putative uncharacterized protein YnbD [Iris pallida]|uniref:Uncharacterized protein n=1 Tax=Iris pallida TaxID=29817 RepID=A0AAX6EA68_IRIPA|nr:putative uncharacterized protein YnbD [Iris pallida]KAJ6806885.1 putative uncharacterized protein YnbD [Iris pallida]KAJ6852695.1 putative uncharacterized protein YnbD [Iris pallida]
MREGGRGLLKDHYFVGHAATASSSVLVSYPSALLKPFSSLKKLKRKEAAYNENSEGLYIGGWPSSPDRFPPEEPVVIDCICELPRTSVVSKDAYLCIPTWDTRSPQPAQIETAVRWACQFRAQKKGPYTSIVHLEAIANGWQPSR